MRDFAYARAADLTQAVAALADGAVAIAGGTELLNWMRLGIADTDAVVDIGRLAELRGIAVEGDLLRIGALATLNEIGESELVRTAAPVLAQACLKAASAQLRNLATIGGNVLQKTRCPYFRAEAAAAGAMPWPCNKRAPGTGCAARDSGYARLALFGGTDECVATQPSDPAVALAALDATVHVAGAAGTRQIPMTDFHLTQEEAARARPPGAGGPGGPPGPPGDAASVVMENRLRRGELIVGYSVPIGDVSRHSAYLKVRERESYEYALVAVAAAVARDGARIRTVRIALGSVAQKPWRLTPAETALAGQTLDASSIDRALETALAAARPPAGNEFRVVLARNAARRALLAAGGVQ
ncbi:MAG TPA: FAD binding domain-containing protein [Thermoanaerobaculia bacterium]|nr:FAD binding domain-containing protein [Thermoanaerobaculia bacterium]